MLQTYFPGIFLLISGGVFASNNDQTATSLAGIFSQNCPPFAYGYGFVFAWISFAFVVGGCVMSAFNSRRLAAG